MYSNIGDLTKRMHNASVELVNNIIDNESIRGLYNTPAAIINHKITRRLANASWGTAEYGVYILALQESARVYGSENTSIWLLPGFFLLAFVVSGDGFGRIFCNKSIEEVIKESKLDNTF